MSPSLLIQNTTDAVYRLVKEKESKEVHELTQQAHDKIAELKTILDKIEKIK